MLYHFPEESPEDLLQQENELLNSQIRKAKRVETHGYRPKEPSLSSFFVEWNVIHKYLGCPIKKWSWPVSSKDKVELEPLPTDFLPPLWTLKPLKFYDPESKEYVRRIVGFREIQQKREYIEYLKEIEAECEDDDDSGGDDSGERDELIRIDMESENTEDEDDNSGEFEETENETEAGNNANASMFYKTFPLLRIARGGGKKDNKGKGGKGGGGGGGDKGKKKDQKDNKDKDKGKGKKGKKQDGDKGKPEEKEGIIQKIIKYFKGETTGKNDKKGKKGEKEKEEQKKKEAEKAKKEKETKAKSKGKEVDSHGWLGIAKYWKEVGKQKLMLEKEHQQNIEQIFKYHGLFRVRAARERDSEWLELSHTDPDESAKEIQTFDKPQAEWMKEGISFESQYLARTLRIFTFFTNLTGRSFLRITPDEEKGHMDFRHRKRDVILFFLTSILCWICFCLMSISFILIQAENQAEGISRAGAAAGSGRSANSTTDELATRASTGKHEVEELMLTLYEIPLYVILINLILVAIWSILVILGDGIFIAHYFNCWCAALAEMETSGCLGIRNLIIKNHVIFLIYTGIMVGLFYLDYPKQVRFSNLMITALIMKNFKPYIRIDTDEHLLPYMIGGMVFQIYIVYCAMMIKLLMAIMATILKNASEMWNFKFAVTFQQLATKNRGQLLRMGLNHSLLKLFTHHRILTVLLRTYGQVFSTPIMLYMVMEMGVITIAMVRWFFYKALSEKDYNGTEFVIINTLTTDPDVKEEIHVPYFHSRADTHITLYLMMFQLLVQFMYTSDVLARAGDSFFAGYEFVRRSGTILCRNSHQRRLIQSLEWSFSSTNPSVLSANSYFAINRASILSSFAAVAGFFSLIIQLQVQPEFNQIKFNTIEDCRKYNMELFRGECVPKVVVEQDASLQFRSSN